MRDHPTDTRTSRTISRRDFGAGLTGISALLLAGCGSASGTGAAPSSAGSGGDSLDKILADAPVASTALTTGPSVAAIKTAGVLKVGGRETATLFSLKDIATGKVSGFDATLSQMLAKYIIGTPNTALTIVDATTRELLLANHTVDTVFATYTITPERLKKIAFAGPYLVSGLSVMTRADDTAVTKVEDLNGRSVTAQINSTAITALQTSAPKATIVPFGDNSECLTALRQRRVDAYVTDQAILVGNAAKNKDVKVVGQPFTSDPYGIGIALDRPDLVSFTDDWLKLIIEQGLWARLWKQTLGTVVSGAAPTPPSVGAGLPG